VDEDVGKMTMMTKYGSYEFLMMPFMGTTSWERVRPDLKKLEAI
jgi:hypothetical protein